mmetsp:Transcript_88622/g.247936  ORF Transcript_88622/g.247936 Transcript_88622/m.247936 type:complete len:207 (-) Transcript_88622:699-1319(-)
MLVALQRVVVRVALAEDPVVSARGATREVVAGGTHQPPAGAVVELDPQVQTLLRGQSRLPGLVSADERVALENLRARAEALGEPVREREVDRVVPERIRHVRRQLDHPYEDQLRDQEHEQPPNAVGRAHDEPPRQHADDDHEAQKVVVLGRHWKAQGVGQLDHCSILLLDFRDHTLLSGGRQGGLLRAQQEDRARPVHHHQTTPIG